MSVLRRVLGGLFAPAIIVSAPLVSTADDMKTGLRVDAVRAHGELKVDGVLSEEIWERPGFDTFIQRDPNEGAKPTQPTSFWVAYDNEALYVAARMFDASSDSIVARLARRDTEISSDYFAFYIDSYNDKRSGFYFTVNAAGTISDGTLYNDDWSDNTWDGVWEGKAHIDSVGWTVEMKIPFSQLRFQRAESYSWRVNCERFTGRSNEHDYVVFTPKN